MRKVIQQLEEENKKLKEQIEDLEYKLDKLQEAYDRCNWLNGKQCNMIEGSEKRIIDLFSENNKLKRACELFVEFIIKSTYNPAMNFYDYILAECSFERCSIMIEIGNKFSEDNEFKKMVNEMLSGNWRLKDE